MLLGTFVDEVWWPSCGKLRECTRVGYESAYRCHIQPKWAGVDMESITANDIEEWLGSFNQAGSSVVGVGRAAGDTPTRLSQGSHRQ